MLSPPRFSLGVHYSIDWTKLFTKEEIDEFIELYEHSGTTEATIHHFFRRQPKFLYALGAYEAAVSEISFISSLTDASGARMRLRPDFFLQDAKGLWDVVELKKAEFGDLPLIVGQVQRQRFAVQMQNPLAQVRTYLREFDLPEIQQALSESGIVVDQPQAWLIIGRDKDLPLRERHLLEKELPRQLRIVTYDELCSLAKQRAVIVTPTVLLPFLQPTAEKMRVKPDLQKGRIQLDFSPEAHRRLEQLASLDLRGRWTVTDLQRKLYSSKSYDRVVLPAPSRPRNRFGHF